MSLTAGTAGIKDRSLALGQAQDDYITPCLACTKHPGQRSAKRSPILIRGPLSRHPSQINSFSIWFYMARRRRRAVSLFL